MVKIINNISHQVVKFHRKKDETKTKIKPLRKRRNGAMEHQQDSKIALDKRKERINVLPCFSIQSGDGQRRIRCVVMAIHEISILDKIDE